MNKLSIVAIAVVLSGCSHIQHKATPSVGGVTYNVDVARAKVKHSADKLASLKQGNIATGSYIDKAIATIDKATK
jgi:uncharacterized protein YceK